MASGRRPAGAAATGAWRLPDAAQLPLRDRIGGSLAIINAHVLPMKGDTILPTQSVLVRGAE